MLFSKSKPIKIKGGKTLFFSYLRDYPILLTLFRKPVLALRATFGSNEGESLRSLFQEGKDFGSIYFNKQLCKTLPWLSLAKIEEIRTLARHSF